LSPAFRVASQQLTFLATATRLLSCTLLYHCRNTLLYWFGITLWRTKPFW